MKKLTYTLIGITLMQLLFSCGNTETKTPESLPAIDVKVSLSEINTEGAVISASGKIEAATSANLSTRMMGNVTAIHAKMGDQVSKGDLLVSIQSQDLLAKKGQVEAAISQASAANENAKKDFERFKALFEQGSASQKELDDMTTRYEMTQSGLNASKQMKREIDAQFTYTEIRAPYSGMITNTFVKAGDMANPGMPLISMESSGRPQVMVMVSESDVDQIKEGMNASVHVKSLERTFTAKVIEVSRSAKNTGGQFMVKLDLTKNDESVLSGMFVHVRFATGTEEGNSSVLVDRSALVQKGQLTGIYTIGFDNTAILRWLRVGRTIGNQVEILSGLSADETYVSSADGRLFNGAKVTIK